MPAPKLKVVGNRIVTASGEFPVRLRGVHLYYFSHKVMHGSIGPSASTLELGWASKVLDTPANGGWGANIIEFWVDNLPALHDTSDFEFNGEIFSYTQEEIDLWWSHVDLLVDICEAANGYLCLAWHHEHGMAGQHSHISERGNQAMEAVVSRYLNKDWVVYLAHQEPSGFELTTGDWPALKASQRGTIDRIRAIKPDALIGFSSVHWSHFWDEAIADPIDADFPGQLNLFANPHYEPKSTADAIVAGPGGGHPGWPVFMGEFSNNNPVSGGARTEVIDKFEAAQAGSYGYAGWSLSKQGPPEMLNGDSMDTNRTAWGDIMEDGLTTYYEALPVPGDPDPIPDPPAIAVPTPAEKAVEDNTLHWDDGSFGSITVTTTDPRFVQVEHTGVPSGFQLQEPNDERIHLSDISHVHLLIRASLTQIDGLRMIFYDQHVGGSAVFVGADANPSNPLSNYVTQTTEGWSLIEVQRSLLEDLYGSVGAEPFLARIELENRSGAAMAPYQIADWALVTAKQAATIEITTQPLDTPAGDPIGGPPTVLVKDQNGDPLEGAAVEVRLNQGAFAAGSVTSKLTNPNGVAAFDFLVIDTEDTAYQLEFRVQAN